jgi:hypothetical protein
MIRAFSFVFCLGLFGCVAPDKSHIASVAVDAENIYARQSVHFQNAVFYKPAEAASPDMIFKLAPLIILQVSNTDQPTELVDGLVNPDTAASQPIAVNAWTDTVQLRGQPRARVSYLWHHSTPINSKTTGNIRQGVRITFGTDGRPVVWEILADTSGKRLIVVSESLEQAAAQQFGPPLSGRRFSIEASSDASPSSLVMRVIDDGPVAMGPITYLAQGTRDMATLICRCMPSQASNIVGTKTYDLSPLPSPPFVWPGAPLDTALRLPDF